MNTKFRFHTGSIKSLMHPPIMLSLSPCFDSILVRLKAQKRKEKSMTHIMFRFHTGSIKSLRDRKKSQFLVKFRFHTGSIKSYMKENEERQKRVSIPYWFD